MRRTSSETQPLFILDPQSGFQTPNKTNAIEDVHKASLTSLQRRLPSLQQCMFSSWTRSSSSIMTLQIVICYFLIVGTGQFVPTKIKHKQQEAVQRHCGCDVPPPKSLQNGFFCAVEIDCSKSKLIRGTSQLQLSSPVGGGVYSPK